MTKVPEEFSEIKRNTRYGNKIRTFNTQVYISKYSIVQVS